MPAETLAEYKLAQVLERIIDYRGKQPAKTSTGIQLITAKNIRDGYLDLKGSQEFIAEDQYDEWMVRGLPEPGDVLFTTEAPLGNTALFPRRGRFALAQRVVVLRGKQGALLSEYLLHWLRSPEGRIAIQRLATGSTAKGIKQSTLRKMCIRIPSVKVQEWVAPLLTEWDTQLLSVQALVKARRKLKRALLQHLLTGHRRFPEFRKQPWVERRVNEVLQETFRPVSWDDEAEYRLASVRRGSKGLFDRGRLYGRQIKVKKLSAIRTNDFLISHIQAAYGAMGLVPKEFDGSKVSDMYTVLTPKTPGSIDMRFVNYLSQRREFRHMAYLSSNGFFAERLRLNFDPHDFMHRKLLLPPTIEEQSKIADALETLDDEIASLLALHDALKEQKKGLMQKLLTGVVRVPASMMRTMEVHS